MTKEFNKQLMLESLMIGFEFEVFSPHTRPELATLLSHEVNKTVIALESHDPSTVLDYNTFKIEPDFSGGIKMHEIVTPPLPYHEAIYTMLKVLNFINEKCHTTNRCGFHINISVENTEIKESIRNLNIFKFVLSLDEHSIFNLWPSSYQSKFQKVFKNSISYIYPKNRFLSENVNVMTLSNPMDFKIPQTKYHGINFNKLQRGYLEVRYAGGTNYQLKRKESIDLINLVGEHIISTLENNKTYTEAEILKLKSIIDNQREYLSSVRTYEAFIRNYPNIKLTMDMKHHPQAIKATYSTIRESLCDFLEHTNMTKGELNYDSNRSRLQVRGANIKSGFVLSNLDLLECTVDSELEQCMLFNCKVSGALIKKSNISIDNDIKYSVLEDCSYDESSSSKIKHSYLKNEGFTKVSGNFTECIINRGIISSTSEVDKKTELVNIGKDSSQ